MAVQDVVLAIVQSIDTAVGELQAIAQLEDNFIHAHLPAFTQAAFRELVLLWSRLDTIILVRTPVSAPLCNAPLPAALVLTWDCTHLFRSLRPRRSSRTRASTRCQPSLCCSPRPAVSSRAP